MQEILILYGTTTGTTKILANRIVSVIQEKTKVIPKLCDIASYDEENLENEGMMLLLCPTWVDGKPADSMIRFDSWLEECVHDFRVSKTVLSKLSFSILGIGSRAYGDKFCLAASEININLSSLGAISVSPLYLADQDFDLEDVFKEWADFLISYLNSVFTSKDNLLDNIDVERNIAKLDNIHQNKSHQKKFENAVVEEEEEEEDIINSKFMDYQSSDDDEDDNNNNTNEDGPETNKILIKSISDMEDIGSTIRISAIAASQPPSEREMVTNMQRKALVKEGYKIIGSHSAVKLCRWTKNQLRGRGGCYKHTFYGITSYQCMEATPSLACANKCVFCWRHHKNPVGTEWRWKTDSPSFIVTEAISQHQKMINQMRGVPGVQPQRLQEAFTVQHCALSLVGEPIMYPQINEMLSELHARKISTFLVTNAQFPERIAQLDPVTQLYVSVDAATKDTLKAVDRPLFKDFWERFTQSLQELSTKQQRTVYRLTLVKSYNMEEIENYVQLIQTGLPDFIEIKAVTYCGKSDASSLTMQNVPWHREVCEFAEAISFHLQNHSNSIKYSIATAHEHSCCVLLAREDKFKIDGIWHTWIDYPKFHSLIQRYYESQKTESFVSTDYMAVTPEWALYTSEARGFDPAEERWRRTKSGALVEINYKPSGSGCG